MAYAVKADLIPRRMSNNEAIQLTDDTNSPPTKADDTVITGVLDAASALIDSYCRLRYTVPLQTSSQITDLCLDIAEYKLYLRRKRVKDDVRQAYEDAIAFLKDVASNKASLDQPTGATAQTGSDDVQKTAVAEQFTDDNLGGYV